jgi:serine/threonine protein kinase
MESVDPDGLQKSGWLKRKCAFPGIWSKCYCELHQTEFYVRKSDKSPKIEVCIHITAQTQIQYIDHKHFCYIRIDAGDPQPLKLRGSKADLVTEWFVVLRSATFHNPMMSMDSFTILSVLGRGFFGKVMLVSNTITNELYALKTVHKMRLLQSQKVHTILAERNIMGRVAHPFIVSLLFAFQSATKFYLGLEYIPGGELLSLMRARGVFPLSQVRLYIAELSLALNHLHSIGIVYRDLKPENILIAADGHLKLTDFGLAKDLSRLRLTGSFCGTAEYMAPEIIERQEYSFSVDWWALGVLAYALMFGVTPFHDENKAKMFMKISCHEPAFGPDAEPASVDFVRKLLVKDPHRRASFQTLSGHDFWDGLSFDDVLAKRITPEFIPTITDLRSAENFDPEFTGEEALDSLATPPIGDENVFQNFSFVPGMSRDSSQEFPIASRVAPR